MKRLLLRWVLLAVSVFGASLITQALGLRFQVEVKDLADAIQLLLGVAVLSFLNATLGRILKLLTLPLSCITLGLFSLVVNAIVLWIAASLDLGFAIRLQKGDPFYMGFVSAFAASVLISFISGVLGVFLPDDKDD